MTDILLDVRVYDAVATWSLVVIFQNSLAANSGSCSSYSNIWAYSAAAALVLPVAVIVSLCACCIPDVPGGGCVRPTKHGLIAGPPVIVMVCMAVLGMLLWANMTEKCASFYGTNYGGLLMVFKVLVCMMWIGLPITVWSLGSYLSRPEEYHTIPDNAAGANSAPTPAAGATGIH